MGAHQYFGYGIGDVDLPCSSPPSSSYSNIPSIPKRLFGSLKPDLRNSPKSPLLSRFGTEIQTTLSENQEQLPFSVENASGASTPYSSYHDYSLSHHFQQSSPPLHHEEEPQIYSDEVPHLVSGGFHQNTTHNFQELGADQMDLYYAEVSWPNPPGKTEVPQLFDDGFRIISRQNHMSEISWGISSGNLKELLIACARAVSENRQNDFEKLMGLARGSVSIAGEPMQRLGAYMIEGLVARKEASGTNIYRTLKCKEPESYDLLSYMHILYEICPYLKFGYMAANGAIAEACRDEKHIHIIDFQIAQGTQWMTLLHALAAKPGGSPSVRITGIDDPVSEYARADSLELVGKRLVAISEKLNIPFEFHPIPAFAPYVTKKMLDVRPGEALAVNFPIQLHHIPDESVDVNNPRDGLLRMIKSLSPKVVTLIEQESNINTAPFFSRFQETLEYYSAIFESIDVALPRDRKERINVEQHCLARDIVNIIACEGMERVERHELFSKWKYRMTMAGFRSSPLSQYVNTVIRALLRNYSEFYKVKEIDGALLLGWKDRDLISASAWH